MPVRRAGLGVAERLENGYCTIWRWWWYCITAVVLVAYDFTYRYVYACTYKTTTESSKIITYKRGFGLFYSNRGYYYIILSSVDVSGIQRYATQYGIYSNNSLRLHDVILYLVRITSLLLRSHLQKRLRTHKKIEREEKIERKNILVYTYLNTVAPSTLNLYTFFRPIFMYLCAPIYICVCVCVCMYKTLECTYTYLNVSTKYYTHTHIYAFVN